MSGGGSVPIYPLVKKFPTTFERRIYKTYNWLDNVLWPVRPLPFAGAVALTAGINYKAPGQYLFQYLPEFGSKVTEHIAKISLVSFFTYVPVFILRKLLKWFYFSYKGFLFENPKKPSLSTKIWGTVRYLLSFSKPILESCDALLPNMPVPSLDHSITEYLSSMRYILTPEEFEQVTQQANDFLKNEGKRLQFYAKTYALFADNYVTPFWEKYAYLYGRYPLLINSSVAHGDLFANKETTRAHRAARILYVECMSHLAVDRQQYKPLGDGIVCTRHYQKMYCGTRVPGETVDHLVNYGIQKHVIVALRGKLYKVHVCDDRNNMFTIEQLSKIFTELLERDSWENGTIGKVAALTHDRRDDWQKNREKYFLKHENNAKVLKEIESAIVFISLDEDEFSNDWDKPETQGLFLTNMLAGDGTNRWVDKSLNYSVLKNTRAGGTTEHSIADGAEFDHIFENYVYTDYDVIGYPTMEEQKAMEVITESDRKTLKFADELTIEVADETMLPEIERCYKSHQEAKNDVDMYPLLFRDFGKGRIKKCGVSPDGFVQMAIQLASYMDLGKFVLTYEPASSRFYANSRTETLRTVNDHSCEFVYAMLNENESKEKKIELLRRACETHVQRNKNCMVGKGIDRHLFVLYVLSKAIGISSAFLDTYGSQKWILSTSHVPNVTGQNDEDTNTDMTWLGACFGAVAADGYGVCYRFGGNHSIIANVSSYHSSNQTESARFAKHLNNAFHSLSQLFD